MFSFGSLLCFLVARKRKFNIYCKKGFIINILINDIVSVSSLSE